MSRISHDFSSPIPVSKHLRWANDELGPIMHHGVKDPKDVTSFYYKAGCHLSHSLKPGDCERIQRS